MTYTELMVTLATIGLVTTLAVPNLSRWLSTTTLHSAARHIASELQRTRMRAIATNTTMRIRFDPTIETYQMQRQVGTGWQNAGPVNTLSAGIDLVNATRNPTFRPLGTAPGGTTITLQNSQGRRKTIRVSFAGRVKIE